MIALREAECCVLAGTDGRPIPLRRRASRPQLKRDPLGGAVHKPNAPVQTLSPAGWSTACAGSLVRPRGSSPCQLARLLLDALGSRPLCRSPSDRGHPSPCPPRIVVATRLSLGLRCYRGHRTDCWRCGSLDRLPRPARRLATTTRRPDGGRRVCWADLRSRPRPQRSGRLSHDACRAALRT